MTRYIIERRWCPQCRKYQEKPDQCRLAQLSLGLAYDAVCGLSESGFGFELSKIQRELDLYFGLTVSTTTLNQYGR